MLQEHLHCVQKAHDVVLVFEYAIFYQLLSFIESNNVAGEATDSAKHTVLLVDSVAC